MPTRHVVAHANELEPGRPCVVEVAGRSIGVVEIDGEIYAVRNVCPHHGAPLCRGTVSGTMLPSRPHEYEYSDDREHRIIRCPWHGYEFSLRDGRCLASPERLRVKTYRAAREGDEIVVYV